jgi:hypothetical protein
MQDRPKVSSAKWRSMVRRKIEWLQKNEMRKEERLAVLLRHLEDEIDRVESLIEKENEDM